MIVFVNRVTHCRVLRTADLYEQALVQLAGGYEFQAGKVVMNIQSSKVLTQTEELVELLDKAIKEPPPPPDPREEERRRDIRATLRGR